MPEPHNFLRVLDDAFTPVRDTRARLIGCIPRLPDTATDVIVDTQGRIFELRLASQVCVCVDLEVQSPTALEGFVALDDTNTDLAIPAAADDSDIGEAV